ncbi:hypothetical protein BSKO_09536 [Bryopsis sp. KO-2023]|nr:hypothetical protein BSKO_09536 [Bryopsis sp. KO-2023]
MAMAVATSKVLVLLVFVALGLVPGAFSYGWRIGRATNYGDASTGDPASFHSGSCGYGSLWGKGVDNLNVLAIPSKHPDFQWSCGSCYEVKCHPMTYKDNYGNVHHREHACYDPHRVITFAVTDCCPCHSNTQWCCGDMDHFDLSHHGFSQLAARHWGTFGIKYRKVACPWYVSLPKKHHYGHKRF